MNVFAAAFVIRVKTGLQYRVSALAGMSTQFFWGWMLIMIYSAFNAGSNQNPESLPRIIAYVWLQQAFLYAVALWMMDPELTETIRSGQIAYELTRPRDLYTFWLAKLIGARVSGVALRFPPVILFSCFMPVAYRFSPPAGLAAFLLFIAALALGMGIVVTYMLVAYFTLFYVLSSDGVLWVFCVAAQFLAGQFIPLLFIPDRVQQVLYALPFAYVNDFAFRIYTGEYGLAFAARGIGIQLFWIAVLVAVGRWMLAHAVKRTVAQGG